MANPNSIRNLKKKAAKLLKANKLIEARNIYVPLCKSTPNNLESWNTLANIHRSLNDFNNAEFCCKHILSIQPDNHQALHTLAVARHMAQDLHTAISLYHKALNTEEPQNETYYLLANAYRETGNLANARLFYEKLIDRDPYHFEALNNLAALYTQLGIIGKSMQLLKTANKLKPDFPFVMNNLGKVYQLSGQQTKASDTFKNLLEGGKFAPHMVSNYLLSLNYSPDFDQETIYNEHVKWSKELGKNNVSEADDNRHNSNNVINNRILIGILSPDFKDHPVARFILPFLTNFSRHNFSVHCYSDSTTVDHVSVQIKKLANQWTTCHQLTDSELVSTIRNDKIDILIDLAGHTANSRMQVFTEKPASIQYAYIGYPNTTGIEAIDYRLVDDKTDPTGSADKYHTEKLIRLPNCFLCYYPDTQILPKSRDNSSNEIMFGSFNNLAKLTPDVIAAWSGILNHVTNSKLTLKCSATSDPDVQAYLLKQFDKHHINNNRIIFLNSLPNKEDHYNCYNTIDIALDTFPYNGTTTTFDALWMGVPVVTMIGQRHASRVGYSILSNLSLDSLIAKSLEEYQQIAVDLANNKKNRVELQSTLRKRMESSCLLDHKRHTQQLENIFKTCYYDTVKADD